ncbi:MAG TPA: hypothetical protein VJK03_00630 [Candidatus Nanoarchaeia archaeon]|nr:hypothetical protein [Candidatus Nanoarchaeia archaeon]
MSVVLSREHIEKTERGLKLLIDCGYDIVELSPERGMFFRADTIQASANILGDRIDFVKIFYSENELQFDYIKERRKPRMSGVEIIAQRPIGKSPSVLLDFSPGSHFSDVQYMIVDANELTPNNRELFDARITFRYNAQREIYVPEN